ncbi:MAG TPA: DUF937 domain-containing protein [Chitinophagales bacterium]|nr:DUF937 domain-containing protein [Chitinophagales bacterium]HRK28681.1 DUF937 domain-containing protein [Chitinophagales bacterium]
MNNANFVDLLTQQFGGQAAEMIGQQLGIDKSAAQLALSQFLPIFTTALANNASQEEGAQALYNAVEKDHDGSVLENMIGFLGNFSQGPGMGIMGHVFGGQINQVADFISSNTGLDKQTTQSIMQIAAPLAMGMLGKEQRSQGLNAQGLAQLLNTSVQDVKQTDPKNMGLIGKLLDRNNDGNVMDDVAAMGMSLLRNWMNGRK